MYMQSRNNRGIHGCFADRAQDTSFNQAHAPVLGLVGMPCVFPLQFPLLLPNDMLNKDHCAVVVHVTIIFSRRGFFMHTLL